MNMRYFSKDPQVNNLRFNENIPLFNHTSKNRIQITFKDGEIVHETEQNEAVNICMIKGCLQFCIKGEPYIVEEGDILDLDPHACCPDPTTHENAVLLTLVKADEDQAIEEKRKCTP